MASDYMDASTGDPISAIEAMMKARNWTRRHLLPAFGGSRSHLSEALNRVRPISLSTIRCLVFNYGMDANILIQWYPTKMKPNRPDDVFEHIRQINRENP